MIKTSLKQYLFFAVLSAGLSLKSHADSCKDVVKRLPLTSDQGYNLEVKTLCANPDHFDIRVFNKKYSFDLGQILFPYSYNKTLNTVNSPNGSTYIFTMSPSEPMPQGSYYFMIFDTKGHVLLSGYSDNAAYIKNIDNDAYDEVIVGVNTENTDPLEYLLDYVPYPVVYDWNRSGKLELQPSNQYKSLFEKYLLDQKGYKQALKVKIKEQKQ